MCTSQIPKGCADAVLTSGRARMFPGYAANGLNRVSAVSLTRAWIGSIA